MRRQFIDPMFELLGWDVLNRQGHAEAYKEVVHEDFLKMGGSTKSPDYSFRVGPERRSSVETKKPSVNIRGTAEVDAAFLDEIDGWRLVLARHLALRNRDLSQRDLNFAVQKTIDRLIFLRICEDRGMQTYGRLEVLPNGPNIYRRLCELFREADHRYNSGLFHFAAEKDRHELPDEWTLGLTVDRCTRSAPFHALYRDVH